ncbi:unnamed protein product [Anisakis simplex]|uniref:Uncharacterized protein n=1 Tax=Anisakis simplex TaxID=6269 RepID=A0A3P6SCJ4_ANISI|nr:unnamed protein product [Anisakis simplex]
MKKFEASLSYDAPPKTIHRSPATQKSLKDEAWAETLFGPQGVLTAIFRMIDDRQMGPEHVASKASHPANTIPKDTQQHDLPFFLDLDFFKNAKRIDFARIFEAFLTNSQGDFGDPISELPEFLGICNRLSCGDIYKAIDQFRKSEFFTNFQTAMQLIQDPKGWEIIGDLLSNPELIAQFTSGPGGIEKLIGSVTTAVGNKPKPVNGRRPPTVHCCISYYCAFSILSESIREIFRKVESGVDELEETSSGVETVEIAPFPSKTKIESVEVKKEKLPEISESIDEKGEVSIKVDGTDSLVIDKSGYVVNKPLSSTYVALIPSFHLFE